MELVTVGVVVVVGAGVVGAGVVVVVGARVVGAGVVGVEHAVAPAAEYCPVGHGVHTEFGRIVLLQSVFLLHSQQFPHPPSAAQYV